MDLHIDHSALFFYFLTEKLTPKEKSALIKALGLDKPSVEAWQKLETKTCWKDRHEHSVFVFQDKLWIAGGHAQPLSSEVWSLSLPKDWKP